MITAYHVTVPEGKYVPSDTVVDSEGDILVAITKEKRDALDKAFDEWFLCRQDLSTQRELMKMWLDHESRFILEKGNHDH